MTGQAIGDIERELIKGLERAIDREVDDIRAKYGITVRWVDAEWYPDSGVSVGVSIESEEV